MALIFRFKARNITECKPHRRLFSNWNNITGAHALQLPEQYKEFICIFFNITKLISIP